MENIKEKYGWNKQLELFFINSNPVLKKMYRGSFSIKKHNEKYFWYYRLGSHVPKEWKEVDRMSRFFVSDILNSISENRTSCHDTNGVNRRIRGRTWNCLEKILDGWNKDESNSLLSVAMKYPYNVHKVKDKGEKYSFLKNTISLILT